jgi:hypothetical protein
MIIRNRSSERYVARVYEMKRQGLFQEEANMEQVSEQPHRKAHR